MKKCPDCTIHAIHVATLAMTVAASQGRVDECRRLGHVPYKRLDEKHDICVNCLRDGWATLTVLGEVISNPQDLAGRPLRDSESDPTSEGGVWALGATAEDRAYATRWRRILWVLALLAAAGAFFGTLVTWLR